MQGPFVFGISTGGVYRACVSESYVRVEIVIVAVLVLMFVNEYNLFVIFEEMQEQSVASGLCT